MGDAAMVDCKLGEGVARDRRFENAVLGSNRNVVGVVPLGDLLYPTYGKAASGTLERDVLSTETTAAECPGEYGIQVEQEVRTHLGNFSVCIIYPAVVIAIEEVPRIECSEPTVRKIGIGADVEGMRCIGETAN